MPTVARASISVWEGGCLWIGNTVAPYAGDPHSHHALQLSFRFAGSMTFRSECHHSSAPVTLIDADLRHSIEVDGEVAHVFVDPESRAGRALRAETGIRGMLGSLTDAKYLAARDELGALWNSGTSGEALRTAASDLLRRLTGSTPASPSDPRVCRLIEAVDRSEGAIAFASAARDVPLSPSRLRHLFAEEVGLPFKSYVLWRRLMRAVDSVGRGDSLTSAAHHAGFADSAHFSRTFRRNFGLSASMIERL